MVMGYNPQEAKTIVSSNFKSTVRTISYEQ